MKALVGGGLFAGQLRAIRSKPAENYYKPFAVTNFAASGVVGGVAWRNYGIRR